MRDTQHPPPNGGWGGGNYTPMRLCFYAPNTYPPPLQTNHSASVRIRAYAPHPLLANLCAYATTRLTPPPPPGGNHSASVRLRA